MSMLASRNVPTQHVRSWPRLSSRGAASLLRAPVHRRLRTAQLQPCRASSVGGVPTNAGFIPERQPRANWPDYFLSKEDAVLMQLQALQDNDSPDKNFGVEVLYRFANIDLMSWPTLSRYFGRLQDLGRFELFCWQFNEPPFSLLLNHTDWCITSSLSLGESRWAQRVAVRSTAGSAVFEFAMSRLLHDAEADAEAAFVLNNQTRHDKG